jgi:hypothetical protein
MGRLNFRDANEFDPYGVEGTGGLLGMLQAMMQQGQVEPRADLNFRNPGYETPAVSQLSGFGQTPPIRITVRPFDAYSPSDSETSDGEGGLLGRLLALQAEQSRDQPTPVSSGLTQSAPYDPNFRQLSRAPIATRPQGAIGLFNPPRDQSGPSYSSFGDSAPLDLRAPRQGNQAAQPDRSLSDRIQASWDHPHPYGLVAKLKEALNGIEQAVQGSIDATRVPSTEEEAFRQNQGRELGPIGALKGASLLAPVTPGRAGGILAQTLRNGLRNGLTRPTDARAAEQGSPRPFANSTAPAFKLVSPNRNFFSAAQRLPTAASKMSGLADFALPNSTPPFPILAPSFSDLVERIRLQMGARKGGGRKGQGRVFPVGSKGWKIMENYWSAKAARALARELAGLNAISDTGFGPGEYCEERHEKEQKKCVEHKNEDPDWDYLQGCLDRATERRESCKKNKGKRGAKEKAEWGPADEEAYFETGR